MSAQRSKLPGGTRLAALIALVLVACLFAWRANTFLNERSFEISAMSPQQVELTRLIEPVLGRDGVRISARANADGHQTFLIMVNAPDDRFHLDTEITNRISTILEAAAGYDETRDRLQIQPFSFAPGTAGSFQQAELVELGALLCLAALIGFVGFSGTQPRPAPLAAPQRPAFDERPAIHAVPVSHPAANEDSTSEARRLARENPKETASILRAWMTAEKEGRG